MTREEKFEDAAYDAQHTLICERHGKVIADRANYGWGVNGGDDWVSIATKIYGPGEVLTTNVDLATGEMTHSWRDY